MEPGNDEWEEQPIRVKVIGVGGAGNNAVDRLRMADSSVLELAVVNTDFKSLDASPMHDKLMIGRSITGGLSAGGEAEMGRSAAESDRDALARMVEGVDLVFILAGLGGGTGSGAAPVLASIAAEAGAMVVAFVNMPFSREGQRRLRQAEDALVALRDSCHCVISLPNDLIVQQAEGTPTLLEALAIADDWIRRGVQAICSMVFDNGLINVDFATLRGALQYRGGKAIFGFGEGEGPDFIDAALSDFERCPLLHSPDNKFVRKADSLIINIRGGPDMPLTDVHRVMDFVSETFGCKDNIVLGATIDGSLRGKIEITVIGTIDIVGTRRPFTRAPASTRSSPPLAGPSQPLPSRKAAAPALAAAVPVEEPVRARSAESEPVAEAVTGMVGTVETPSPEKPEKRDGQAEFAFLKTEERGYFDKTNSNFHEGQDLDVPTFIRRGIRIVA